MVFRDFHSPEISRRLTELRSELINNEIMETKTTEEKAAISAAGKNTIQGKPTVEKYYDALVDITSSIESGRFTNAGDYVKHYGLSTHFFKILANLGWVRCVRMGKNPEYRTTIQSSKITSHHAATVQKELSKYVTEMKKSANPRPKREPRKLDDYHTEDLIRELRNRGYTGELEKVDKIKL